MPRDYILSQQVVNQKIISRQLRWWMKLLLQIYPYTDSESNMIKCACLLWLLLFIVAHYIIVRGCPVSFNVSSLLLSYKFNNQPDNDWSFHSFIVMKVQVNSYKIFVFFQRSYYIDPRKNVLSSSLFNKIQGKKILTLQSLKK